MALRSVSFVSLPSFQALQFDSVSAPRGKQEANGRLALIEDAISLPSLLRLRSRSHHEGLYFGQHLSVRKIAWLADVSRFVVLESLDRFGIPQNGNSHKRTGHLPFGFDYLNYKVVKNKAEQDVIWMIRQYRVNGLSLREIAGQLNQRLIHTKNNGVW